MLPPNLCSSHRVHQGAALAIAAGSRIPWESHPVCPRRCPSVNSRPASQPSQASPQQTQHRQSTQAQNRTHPGAMPINAAGPLASVLGPISTVGYIAGLAHSLHRVSIFSPSRRLCATRTLVHPWTNMLARSLIRQVSPGAVLVAVFLPSHGVICARGCRTSA